jgi:hypothetical protein
MVDWYVHARSYGNCNCDHACPCQFEGLPNDGFCQAIGAFQVDEGVFGEVDLTGVTARPVRIGGSTQPCAIRCTKLW